MGFRIPGLGPKEKQEGKKKAEEKGEAAPAQKELRDIHRLRTCEASQNMTSANGDKCLTNLRQRHILGKV